MRKNWFHFSQARKFAARAGRLYRLVTSARTAAASVAQDAVLVIERDGHVIAQHVGKGKVSVGLNPSPCETLLIYKSDRDIVVHAGAVKVSFFGMK